MMEDKNKLDESELKSVSGGTNVTNVTQRFKQGDRVKLVVYPEFGVGEVMNVYFDGTVYKCVAKFNAGTMEAPEIEFELVQV